MNFEMPPIPQTYSFKDFVTRLPDDVVLTKRDLIKLVIYFNHEVKTTMDRKRKKFEEDRKAAQLKKDALRDQMAEENKHLENADFEISKLYIDARPANALDRSHIYTVGELYDRCLIRDDLLKIRGISDRSADTIIDALEEAGFDARRYKQQ